MEIDNLLPEQRIKALLLELSDSDSDSDSDLNLEISGKGLNLHNKIENHTVNKKNKNQKNTNFTRDSITYSKLKDQVKSLNFEKFKHIEVEKDDNDDEKNNNSKKDQDNENTEKQEKFSTKDRHSSDKENLDEFEYPPFEIIDTPFDITDTSTDTKTLPFEVENKTEKQKPFSIDTNTNLFKSPINKLNINKIVYSRLSNNTNTLDEKKESLQNSKFGHIKDINFMSENNKKITDTNKTTKINPIANKEENTNDNNSNNNTNTNLNENLNANTDDEINENNPLNITESNNSKKASKYSLQLFINRFNGKKEDTTISNKPNDIKESYLINTNATDTSKDAIKNFTNAKINRKIDITKKYHLKNPRLSRLLLKRTFQKKSSRGLSSDSESNLNSDLNSDSDSDSDIDILPCPNSSISKKDSSLNQIDLISLKLKNKKLTPKENAAWLLRENIRQLAKEREERKAEFLAKGGKILTKEEKEKEEQDVEAILERQRKIAEETRAREKKLSKKQKKNKDNGNLSEYDSEEDEDYNDNDFSENDDMSLDESDYGEEETSRIDKNQPDDSSVSELETKPTYNLTEEHIEIDKKQVDENLPLNKLCISKDEYNDTRNISSKNMKIDEEDNVDDDDDDENIKMNIVRKRRILLIDEEENDDESTKNEISLVRSTINNSDDIKTQLNRITGTESQKTVSTQKEIEDDSVTPTLIGITQIFNGLSGNSNSNNDIFKEKDTQEIVNKLRNDNFRLSIEPEQQLKYGDTQVINYDVESSNSSKNDLNDEENSSQISELSLENLHGTLGSQSFRIPSPTPYEFSNPNNYNKPYFMSNKKNLNIRMQNEDFTQTEEDATQKDDINYEEEEKQTENHDDFFYESNSKILVRSSLNEQDYEDDKLISLLDLRQKQVEDQVKKQTEKQNFKKTLRNELKNIFEEEAEESDDEYAGLGGKSDDENDDEYDSDVEKMIDKDGDFSTIQDGQKLAAFHAQEVMLQDEEMLKRVTRDVNDGFKRRRRDFLDLSDDSDEEEERRKMQIEKKMRREKQRQRALNNSKAGSLAQNPKNKAFVQSILEIENPLKNSSIIDLSNLYETEDGKTENEHRLELNKENPYKKNKKEKETYEAYVKRQLSFLIDEGEGEGEGEKEKEKDEEKGKDTGNNNDSSNDSDEDNDFDIIMETQNSMDTLNSSPFKSAGKQDKTTINEKLSLFRDDSENEIENDEYTNGENLKRRKSELLIKREYSIKVIDRRSKSFNDTIDDNENENEKWDDDEDRDDYEIDISRIKKISKNNQNTIKENISSSPDRPFITYSKSFSGFNNSNENSTEEGLNNFKIGSIGNSSRKRVMRLGTKPGGFSIKKHRSDNGIIENYKMKNTNKLRRHRTDEKFKSLYSKASFS